METQTRLHDSRPADRDKDTEGEVSYLLPFTPLSLFFYVSFGLLPLAKQLGVRYRLKFSEKCISLSSQ